MKESQPRFCIKLKLVTKHEDHSLFGLLNVFTFHFGDLKKTGYKCFPMISEMRGSVFPGVFAQVLSRRVNVLCYPPTPIPTGDPGVG